MLLAATPAFFGEIAALVVASALIAYLCHRLGIMPIVGFLVAGVVIGPMGIGLVEDLELVNEAAEVGVVLLLFTIGIEFSLEKLAKIQRLIFGGGGLQVGLAMAATMGILVLFGVSWQIGLFTGFLVALSSTAIVLKMLGDRGEMDRPYAQAGLGLLIFQDLAIIVMVLLVPMLGGAGGTALDIGWALGKAGLIIVLVLVLARRIMPKFLEAVARTCSPELFLLTVIGICFGTAYLTSLAGVSLSLGAFLAGLIVSESRFSEHAMGEIMPLQILFSATFFVSVGMLLDLGFLLEHLPLVLGVVLAVVLLKVITTAFSIRILGYSMPVALASGLILAQIGEFSFVLARAGGEIGLYPAGLEGIGEQTFIASTVIVMILTPVLGWAGARLFSREAPLPAGTDEPALDHQAAEGLSDHVVVAGYGASARRLVRVLQNAGIPFIVTTLSPEGANEAEAAGVRVLRGDYSRQHILELTGIARARALVVADDHTAMSHRVIQVAKTLKPDLHIIVRTRYIAEIEHLHAAGASCVIAEEMESIVQLFAQILQDVGTPASQIEAIVNGVRDGDYASLLEPEAAVAASLVDGGVGGMHHTIVLEPVNPGACSHIARTRPVVPSTSGCEECLRTGDHWVHLRVCMTCGHVGCCDSSKNKHAGRHYLETDHPIARSIEPGETWAWCYVDEVIV
ncbi:MAG: cation:proton antiporter [Rhodothermales bacterium]|nr:cation:proton antiporter [Rhodothermales bacterium]